MLQNIFHLILIFCHQPMVCVHKPLSPTFIGVCCVHSCNLGFLYTAVFFSTESTVLKELIMNFFFYNSSLYIHVLITKFYFCDSSNYMWKGTLESDLGNVSSVGSLFYIKIHGSVILDDIKGNVHSSAIFVHEDSQNSGRSRNICGYIQARNPTPVICVGKLLLIVQTLPSIKRQVNICNIINWVQFVSLISSCCWLFSREDFQKL